MRVRATLVIVAEVDDDADIEALRRQLKEDMGTESESYYVATAEVEVLP